MKRRIRRASGWLCLAIQVIATTALPLLHATVGHGGHDARGHRHGAAAGRRVLSPPLRVALVAPTRPLGSHPAPAPRDLHVHRPGPRSRLPVFSQGLAAHGPAAHAAQAPGFAAPGFAAPGFAAHAGTTAGPTHLAHRGVRAADRGLTSPRHGHVPNRWPGRRGGPADLGHGDGALEHFGVALLAAPLPPTCALCTRLGAALVPVDDSRPGHFAAHSSIRLRSPPLA